MVLIIWDNQHMIIYNLQLKNYNLKVFLDNDYEFIKTHFPDATEKEYNSTKVLFKNK